jgi:hypothetical protein
MIAVAIVLFMILSRTPTAANSGWVTQIRSDRVCLNAEVEAGLDRACYRITNDHKVDSGIERGSFVEIEFTDSVAKSVDLITRDG